MKTVAAGEDSSSIERVSRRRPHMDGRMVSSRITVEVARVTIEDFGSASKGGAELPFARMKPVADGRERKVIRVGFAGKYGGFGRRGSLL